MGSEGLPECFFGLVRPLADAPSLALQLKQFASAQTLMKSYLDGGGADRILAWGVAVHLFNFGWTLSCASLMGWPRERPAATVQRRDLVKFWRRPFSVVASP